MLMRLTARNRTCPNSALSYQRTPCGTKRLPCRRQRRTKHPTDLISLPLSSLHLLLVVCCWRELLLLPPLIPYTLSSWRVTHLSMPSPAAESLVTPAKRQPRHHNALGKMSVVAAVIPAATLIGSYQTSRELDIAMVSLFGALGFSAAALLLWLRANYLAANFLEERHTRRAHYVQSLSTTTPTTAAGGTTPPDGAAANTQARARPCREPRTVARLDPVFPAFFCVCALLAAGACIFIATLKVVWDVRVTMTKDSTPS